jgi:DNA invertase Pin-like site-specific DNA recombinase
MDAYCRVSRVAGRSGESFISVDVQRSQIEAWAKLRGVEIAAWHEDLDQSGGKLDRPGLNALLARIESGQTGGVAVAKLDRLSRLGVADALKLVERIQESGGSIAAIDLGIDPTTAFGEFGMTIMLALARMERRRLSESWDIAKSRAIDRGVKIGPTPFGYQRNEDGTLSIDPEASVVVAEAFRRAGQAIHHATEYLRETVPERTWNLSTVRRTLASRTYLGESNYGNLINPKAHEPIVNRAQWQAAQSAPETRRRAPEDFPLSGFATCAGCGAPMVGGRAGKGKRTYRCSHSLAFATVKCLAPANMTADRLEEYVVEYLRENWESNEWKVLDAPPTDIGSAQDALEDAEAELLAFAEDLTLRKALGSRYHAVLALRENAVEDAQAAFTAQAKESVRLDHISPEELLETEKLGDILRAAFVLIEVARGRGPVEDRVRLLFRGSWKGGQVERALTDLHRR